MHDSHGSVLRFQDISGLKVTVANRGFQEAESIRRIHVSTGSIVLSLNKSSSFGVRGANCRTHLDRLGEESKETVSSCSVNDLSTGIP